MAADLPTVVIHYHRPPAGEEIFRQLLVHDEPRVKVTLATSMRLEQPKRIDGVLVLEEGSDAVWFTFPGAWHDIGRFHDAEGTFTGVYTNILTPPQLRPNHVWHTTDLFLDLWVPAGGEPRTLDREEFDEAVRRGWIGDVERRRARQEVRRLLELARRGRWPPAIVWTWTLERARAAAGLSPHPPDRRRTGD